MDDAYWWRTYLNLRFRNLEELETYARDYNQYNDPGVQQRLRELRGEPEPMDDGDDDVASLSV